MSKLHVQALTKKYDSGVLAIDKLNLTVEDGEFLVLLGQEKSAKSTILRVIAGLEDFTEGDILLDNESIRQKPSKERDIAMFFQANTLQSSCNIYENIAYGLKLRKESEELIQKKVNKIAEILAIKDLLVRRPKSLTALQRLKVVLARAIVREPKLLLFDEPFANLNETLRQEIIDILIQLQIRFKFTTIFATNNIREAFMLADKIAILKEGKIEQIDSPLNLLEKPINFYVADYLSNFTLDLYACKLVEEEGKYFAKAENFLVELDAELLAKMTHLQDYITNNETFYFAKSNKEEVYLFDKEKKTFIA